MCSRWPLVRSCCGKILEGKNKFRTCHTFKIPLERSLPIGTKNWNQKVESCDSAVGYEGDMSSILNGLLAVLGLYQYIFSAFLQVRHFSKQLEIIYETVIMSGIKTEFKRTTLIMSLRVGTVAYWQRIPTIKQSVCSTDALEHLFPPFTNVKGELFINFSHNSPN